LQQGHRAWIAKLLGNCLGALKVTPDTAMRMGGENTERPTAIDGRYRALLDVASAIAEAINAGRTKMRRLNISKADYTGPVS
jgi:hypothetical protein